MSPPPSPPRVAKEPPVIRRLNEAVVNRIAAGEVVQRPSAAVKELVENSLDAGSTSVSVSVKDGGLKLILVSDNGHGIRYEDLPILCERHTTSKLSEFEDLQTIKSMGFRGEALASMTYVGHVTVMTITEGQLHGYRVSYKDGVMENDPKPCAAVKGTQIMHGASRADVHTIVARSRLDAIRSVYGVSVARDLMEITASDDDPSRSVFKMDGYISNANYISKKTMMVLFINGTKSQKVPVNKMVRTDSLDPAGRLHAYLPDKPQGENEKQSNLAAVRISVRQRRNPKESADLTSIHQLLDDIECNTHSGLLETVKHCTYVGMADDTFALLQHNTRLYLANVMNTELLMQKAEMLLEYFCIQIDEQGNLLRLPVILDQYTPDMDHLPEFMLSLGNDVDWEDEKECLQTISAALGNFYAMHPPILPNPAGDGIEYYKRNREKSNDTDIKMSILVVVRQFDIVADDNNNEGNCELEQELLAEAETAWAQREWTIQHVLFPSMRLFLKPPKSMATNGTFVQDVDKGKNRKKRQKVENENFDLLESTEKKSKKEAINTNAIRWQLDEYVEQRQALASMKRGESRKKRELKISEGEDAREVNGHDLGNGDAKFHAVEGQEEYLEREIEKRFLRTNPLGKDKLHNRYWFFRRDGRIFVESSDSTQWGYYTTKEELDLMMGSLNPKGVRERNLKRQLEKHYQMISLALQKRSKDTAQKVMLESAVLRRSTRVRAHPKENPATAFLKYVNKWKEN
ncbi:DNA mismatch repair protein MLH1 [Acorus gramineus]|uniref:DNA mismatch repair protein MLH1 n=1 Tax=Acorus gramineus TaxID=55184 RepID=A0AAV9BJJ5_ACOGR|nr:DNA mismatch repair protein MLH1 [Acorus gramineus]